MPNAPFPARLLTGGLLLGLALSAAAAPLPVCTAVEAQVPRVDREEAEAHRQFERPTWDYPPGTDPEEIDGYLDFSVRVDATGRATCVDGAPGSTDPSLRMRHKLATEAAAWRYTPFERDGHPVVALVHQPVDEQILFTRRVPVPPITAADFSVTFVRAGCFFGCPEYAVTVRGDGGVGYVGTRHVDVDGTHAWQVPAGDVARLVAMASDPLLWAADDRYLAEATDQETTMLRVDAGGHRKQVFAYGGDLAGMPVAIRRLQEAVDAVAGTEQWTALSHAVLDRLQHEGFDFRSEAAGAMLYRAMTNRRGRINIGDVDASAILRLIELGAPVGKPMGDGRTPLEAALRVPHPPLIEPLIARTFPTGEPPSQEALDAAFRAAIVGGRLSAVQRIWDAAGGRVRPSLMVVDPTNPDLPDVKRIPVVLLLDGRAGANAGWEGFAIARWLAERGADLTATRKDGRTLLHVAAEADDAPFFHWLLERELDPRPLGDTELMDIGVRLGEDTALALLEAQARQGGEWRLAPTYRFVAEFQGWPRVISWLDAHPEIKERRRCGQACSDR